VSWMGARGMSSPCRSKGVTVPNCAIYYSSDWLRTVRPIVVDVHHSRSDWITE
jgi:hypothetical protein